MPEYTYNIDFLLILSSFLALGQHEKSIPIKPLCNIIEQLDYMTLVETDLHNPQMPEFIDPVDLDQGEEPICVKLT